MEPRISIVTPSFNQVRYIEQTILSVLEQDHPNVEHVIFDGGSKDGTLDILRRYETRGVRWTSEKDKGQSDAINKGFRAATGDIIGWINSDDWYARGAFRVVLDYFEKHPEAQWVYGNNFFTDAEGRVMERFRAMPYSWEWLVYTALLIPQPGVFMRRRVAEDCGLLDEKLVGAMDFEWWLRIARKHTPHFIDRYLAYFRRHPSSITTTGRFHDINFREVAEARQKNHPCPPAVARLQHARASVTKRLARWYRRLTGPAETALHCAPRTVVLVNLIAPYRVASYNALHDHHDLETQIWALAAAENRQWKVAEAGMRFPHRTLDGATLTLPGQALEKQRFIHLNTGLLRDLWRERPNAVVAAEFTLASLQAALYCMATGAALVSWSDTTPEFERHVGRLQRWLRRWIIRRAAAHIATSADSRDKYRGYGARDADIFVSLQTADVDAIAARCDALRPHRASVRQRLGFTDSDVVVLYVGSFIERKGLDLLLEGFAEAAKTGPSLRLLLVGSGEQEAALKAQAAALGVAGRVQWMSYHQQEELWEVYASADAFVLPSRLDVFGVVVIEAAAAGLPVLCSRHAGAARDLVADGKNGWVIEPENIPETAARLVALAQDPDLRAAMRAESRQRAPVAAPGTAAAEFHRAILHALASCGRR